MTTSDGRRTIGPVAVSACPGGKQGSPGPVLPLHTGVVGSRRHGSRLAYSVVVTGTMLAVTRPASPDSTPVLSAERNSR